MASILAEMLDRPGVAIQHLLAARYIAELGGGPNHPGRLLTHVLEHILLHTPSMHHNNILIHPLTHTQIFFHPLTYPDVGAMYLRIAAVLGQLNRLSDDEISSTEKSKEDNSKGTNVSKEQNNNSNTNTNTTNNNETIELETSKRREIMLRCLAMAKSKTYDVEQSAVITKNVAELLSEMGHYNSALAEQRTVLKTFDQLYDSPEDERRVDAKARVEKYLRLNTIEKVAAAKEVQRIQMQQLAEKQPTISGVNGSANGNGTNGNNTNTGGNSTAHAEKESGSPGKKKKSK